MKEQSPCLSLVRLVVGRIHSLRDEITTKWLQLSKVFNFFLLVFSNFTQTNSKCDAFAFHYSAQTLRTALFCKFLTFKQYKR